MMIRGRNVQCRQGRKRDKQRVMKGAQRGRARRVQEQGGMEEQGRRGRAGGEEKRVMWRDLALESGGWFIKCSKVQVEKVRMDLTCLRRW